MSKRRQERLNALLASGDQAEYEAELEATRARRQARVQSFHDTAARQAAEADLEDLADRAIERDGFDPDFDLE